MIYDLIEQGKFSSELKKIFFEVVENFEFCSFVFYALKVHLFEVRSHVKCSLNAEVEGEKNTFPFRKSMTFFFI